MKDATHPSGTHPVAWPLLGCVSSLLFLLVLGSCVLPPALFRLRYGRGPLTKDIHRVRKGMTYAEVIHLLGTPHTTRPDADTWVYFTDNFTLNCCTVEFGRYGRVEDTHEPW